MSSPGNPDIEHLEIYCLLLHVSKKIGKQLVLDQAGNSKDETVSMGMAARFAALRRKIEASVTPYSKVRGVERTAGAVRFCTIDKMGKAVGSRSAQRKQNGKKRKRQHEEILNPWRERLLRIWPELPDRLPLLPRPRRGRRTPSRRAGARRVQSYVYSHFKLERINLVKD